jgi:hypothetical protein
LQVLLQNRKIQEQRMIPCMGSRQCDPQSPILLGCSQWLSGRVLAARRSMSSIAAGLDPENHQL